MQRSVFGWCVAIIVCDLKAVYNGESTTQTRVAIVQAQCVHGSKCREVQKYIKCLAASNMGSPSALSLRPLAASFRALIVRSRRCHVPRHGVNLQKSSSLLCCHDVTAPD